MPLIERPAQGAICQPYLVVSHTKTYGGAIYTWDHHHMAMRFAYDGRPQYLRHLVDNLVRYQEASGFTPTCLHPDVGPRNSFAGFHAQPFLAQSAALYVGLSGDDDWARSHYEPLRRYLAYYETHLGAGDLFRWALPYHSGIDNDAATAFLPAGRVVSADLPSWIYLEYRAMARLSRQIGRGDDDASYRHKAARLRAAINRLLWNEQLGTYTALDLVTGRPHYHLANGSAGEAAEGYHAFQSASNLIPLYAGVAEPEPARRAIEGFVLSEHHFLSSWGIRSLSKSSEFYNNAVFGNPPRFEPAARMTNSNWQGPVWILLSYFLFHAMRRYGYPRAAEDLAQRTWRVLAGGLQLTGAFSENYDAETGRPLYAQGFASWNILADVLVETPGKFGSVMEWLWAD